jgi:hypothetical protein
VTIAGELLSNVASATNSNANSTEPTTAKKARTGIGVLRTSFPAFDFVVSEETLERDWSLAPAYAGSVQISKAT